MSRSIFLGDLRTGTHATPKKASPSVLSGAEVSEVKSAVAPTLNKDTPLQNAIKPKGKGVKKKCCGG